MPPRRKRAATPAPRSLGAAGWLTSCPVHAETDHLRTDRQRRGPRGHVGRITPAGAFDQHLGLLVGPGLPHVDGHRMAQLPARRAELGTAAADGVLVAPENAGPADVAHEGVDAVGGRRPVVQVTGAHVHVQYQVRRAAGQRLAVVRGRWIDQGAVLGHEARQHPARSATQRLAQHAGALAACPGSR